MTDSPRALSADPRKREPLVRWMLEALRSSGCRILHSPDPACPPYRITFETRLGERMGIIAYAFTITSRVTKGRPEDEARFQLKYGKKTGEEYELWQDPYDLYTTLLVGIDPEGSYFVGADPVLHSPTKFYISLEFKHAHIDQIRTSAWHVWEREHRQTKDDEGPVEVLVGGTAESFLRYIRFEREAVGEDQGHRYQLATQGEFPLERLELAASNGHPVPAESHLHAMAREFQLSPDEILELIDKRRRLRTAVRGGVAEIHLVRSLQKIKGVTDLESLDLDAGGDVSLRYLGSRRVLIECKNVRGVTSSNGLAQIDFQRTRASKADPCSRYYSPSDFDVVAACLHPVTSQWEFSYGVTRDLDEHNRCPGRLASNVRLDPERWRQDVVWALRKVLAT